MIPEAHMKEIRKALRHGETILIVVATPADVVEVVVELSRYPRIAKMGDLNFDTILEGPMRGVAFRAEEELDVEDDVEDLDEDFSDEDLAALEDNEDFNDEEEEDDL